MKLSCKKNIAFCIFLVLSFSIYASAKKDTHVEDRRTRKILVENVHEEEPPVQINEYEIPEIEDVPLTFKEIWGYVLYARANEFTSDMPLTDIGLFSAEVNSYGELDEIPRRNAIKNFSGRVHLVITISSRSLTHFCLDPQFGVRKKLIAEIVAAAKDFDGVQLDLEYIPKRDKENYFSFINDMRKALGKSKMLTMCVAARTKLLEEDTFPYARLSDMVDRIVVMAYDEHWSTSKPGPIASYDWCDRIANYAVATIPMEKLIMGMPFYGRTWQTQGHAGAWYNSRVNRIIRENEVAVITREKTVPSFSYNAEVTVIGYFEDAYSTVAKCRLYDSKGVKNIAFWQVGQADPNFWQYIVCDNDNY